MEWFEFLTKRKDFKDSKGFLEFSVERGVVEIKFCVRESRAALAACLQTKIDAEYLHQPPSMLLLNFLIHKFRLWTCVS